MVGEGSITQQPMRSLAALQSTTFLFLFRWAKILYSKKRKVKQRNITVQMDTNRFLWSWRVAFIEFLPGDLFFKLVWGHFLRQSLNKNQFSRKFLSVET